MIKVVTRISNNMVYQSYLTNLNTALYNQTKAEAKVYGPKLTRPSDNPMDAALDMRYKASLSTSEQHFANTETALEWMNATHDAMNQVSEILQRVQELVTQAANDTNIVENRELIAEEVEQLKQQLVEVGNTQLGDRYIFGGQKDREGAPFSYDATTGLVTYNGDDNKISMVVSPGAANPSVDGVNVTGYELFNGDPATNTFVVFDNLNAIITNLKAGNTTYLTGTALQNVSDDLDNLLTTQARLSAKVSAYEYGKSRLELVNDRLGETIGNLEYEDTKKAIIDWTNMQNVYNAVLGMGSYLLKTTLLDYL